MRKLAFVLCLAGFLSYGCNLHHAPLEIDITLSETCTQQQALPLLAMADVAGDKEAAAIYFDHSNNFVANHSDTVTVDVEQYIKAGQAISLFKCFAPNVVTAPDQDTFQNSAIFGFSNKLAVAQAEKIMQAGGVLKNGPEFKWLPYNSGNMALVAYNKGAKVLGISGKDIVATNVRPIKSGGLFWNTVNSIRGRTKYMVTITLAQDTIARIKSGFAPDAPLLVSCNYNGKKLYCSATASQIINSTTLADHLNDEGLAFQFKCAACAATAEM